MEEEILGKNYQKDEKIKLNKDKREDRGKLKT